MQTLIRDILLRDPSKEGLVNNGQARIQPTPAMTTPSRNCGANFLHSSVRASTREGIIKILSSFLGSLNQTHQKAAWVSGFFGSGKSHLLKMLCHLWADTKFADGVTARTLVSRLPDECGTCFESWTLRESAMVVCLRRLVPFHPAPRSKSGLRC